MPSASSRAVRSTALPTTPPAPRAGRSASCATPPRRPRRWSGIATHLPGLFYLLALNSIIIERQGVVTDIWHVLVYNAIWYGVSVAAVFFLVIRPSAARDAFRSLNDWARGHQRPILVAIFGIVGVYLVAHGIVQLAR